jgi:hypothetical protein
MMSFLPGERPNFFFVLRNLAGKLIVLRTGRPPASPRYKSLPFNSVQAQFDVITDAMKTSLRTPMDRGLNYNDQIVLRVMIGNANCHYMQTLSVLDGDIVTMKRAQIWQILLKLKAKGYVEFIKIPGEELHVVVLKDECGKDYIPPLKEKTQ